VAGKDAIEQKSFGTTGRFFRKLFLKKPTTQAK
jgi:hypothetical protein